MREARLSFRYNVEREGGGRALVLSLYPDATDISTKRGKVFFKTSLKPTARELADLDREQAFEIRAEADYLLSRYEHGELLIIRDLINEHLGVK